MELQGKTAVITGGASGIGLATAKQLASSGVNLVLGDIESGPLQTAVDGLRASGANVIGLSCDVSKEEDVLALRDAAIKEFDTAHIIFNNAGVGSGPTIGTPKKVWDWVMQVNVDGVINGINAFVPLFLDQNEGHVVNTGSLAGLGGVPGMGPYCASKFAVVGLSESLYFELLMSGKNVGVSALCPGFVRTRIHESMRNLPKELANYNDNSGTRVATEVAASAVNSGIDPADVAVAVENAIKTNSFWILTHARSAIRTTELRAAWMQGGPPPGIDLNRAAKG